MEIQLTSFILGMGLVLVIAVAVVSVVAIVKVMRLNKTVYNNAVWANTEFENTRKVFDTKDLELDHKIGNIYRDMDSRIDKLYEKIIKNKSPLKTMIERHPELDNDEFKSGILQILNKEDEGNDLKNRILQLMNK